jgi:hypothetical protein
MFQTRRGRSHGLAAGNAPAAALMGFGPSQCCSCLQVAASLQAAQPTCRFLSVRLEQFSRKVLNLPSQVGFLLAGSALAQAYRVTIGRLEPRKWVLAQNRMRQHVPIQPGECDLFIVSRSLAA